MFKERIENWKEEIIKVVNNILAKEGHLAPAVLFLSKNGNTTETQALNIYDMLSVPNSKDVIADAISETCKSLNDKFLAYIFLSEAWATKILPEEIKNGTLETPVSEREAKFEVVVLQCESIYSSETITFDIIREGGLASIANKSVNVDAVGRFTNLNK